MKKLLTVFALLMGLILPANATTTQVQALQEFSLSNPPQTLLIKVLSNLRLNKDVMLHEGFYVVGQVQVVGGKFVFIPVKYQNFHNEVFEIAEQYPAIFKEVIEPANTNGNIPKDAKLLFDFQINQPVVDNSYGERFKDAPTEGISATVNKENMIIYDNTIPQTMKDFPGIKLNSFDNGSNFNIPKKLVIQPEKMERNINSLKEEK